MLPENWVMEKSVELNTFRAVAGRKPLEVWQQMQHPFYMWFSFIPLWYFFVKDLEIGNQRP